MQTQRDFRPAVPNIEGGERRQGQTDHLVAIPAHRVLRKLGEDLLNVRRQRRKTMALVAQQAQLSRTTVTRVEQGDPGLEAVGLD